jgi:LPXTG-motif cell wall-anchored protein
MHSKNFLTAALMSAALMPLAGAFAQDTTTTTTTTTTDVHNTIMDAGIFRDNLSQLHDLFTQMRENHRLAIASADPLLQSQFTEDNRRLRNQSLGILDEVSQNWRKAEMPMQSASASDLTNRYGTADAARFATESDDTAFVRNTVWSLRDMLSADKLNGRDGIITDEMMSMLDAAISRANNPNFRVAQAIDLDRLRTMKIEFSEGDQPTITAGAAAPVAEAPQPQEFHQVYLEHSNLPARNQVAQANETTTTTETTEETTDTGRMGAANPTLPKTGGDPMALYSLGSGLIGLGAILRRKRRS